MKRILLTNDDGFDAPGLQSLRRCLSDAGFRVYVVAPRREFSNCGHFVTVREALRVEPADDDGWIVDGSPADCVRIGIYQLDLPIDGVISGVNSGGNLGVDIPMSGTCAAAREATIASKTAIAISQVRRAGIPIDWDVSGRRAIAAIGWIDGETLPQTHFWNVNLPPVPPDDQVLPVEACTAETASLPIRYEQQSDGRWLFRSDYQNRPRKSGSDVDVCFGGRISVTRQPIF